MRISDWSSDVCSSDLLLAMPVAAAIVVTAALLEDDDLLALLLRDNLVRNGQPAGGLQLAAVTGKQHVRQRHAFACLSGYVFNYDLVSGGDAILLAETGSASRRERVCQYVLISVVAVPLKKNTTKYSVSKVMIT